MKPTDRSRFALIVAIVVAVLASARLSTHAVEPGPERAAGRAGHLGPTPGPSSEGHVRDKRAYLSGLVAQQPATQAAALVSLTKYLPATAAQRMAGSMRAYAVFVKFPGADPEVQIVRTTIAGALADRASDLRNEIGAEVAALKDSGATELIAQRKADLAKISADCPCVSAFAVEKVPLRRLGELAKRPEVRLVDVPDPVVDDLAGWELQPIVPKVAAG